MTNPPLIIDPKQIIKYIISVHFGRIIYVNVAKYYSVEYLSYRFYILVIKIKKLLPSLIVNQLLPIVIDL